MSRTDIHSDRSLALAEMAGANEAGRGTLNLGTLARTAAQAWPNKVAVIEGDRQLTFAQVEARSNQLANALVGRGIEPGDRVAVIVGNCIEWFEITFALLKMGLVRSYVDPRYSLAQLDSQLGSLEPKLIVVGADHVEVIEALPREYADVMVLGDAYEAMIAAESPVFTAVSVNRDTSVEVRYTSGTTGAPRGVLHTHSSWHGAITGIMGAVPIEEDDLVLHVASLGHGAGSLAYMCFNVGASQVVHRGFKAEDVLLELERTKITTTLLVPTMLYRILDAIGDNRPDLSALKTVLYAAAPISPARLTECIDIFGRVFVQTLGLSEAIGGLTFLTKADHVVGAPWLASCGRAAMSGEVRVADEDGRVVGAGQLGELQVRGPSVMIGYWKDPESTRQVLMPDGWFRTGDVARTDDRGFIYLVDRKGDKIVTGGINVYPTDIEHALMTHPNVQEAAIIGVPNEVWGEAVMAIVRVRTGTSVGEAELVEWLRPGLASHQIPKSFVFVTEDLPRTPTGKLVRTTLRAPYWEGHGRSIG